MKRRSAAVSIVAGVALAATLGLAPAAGAQTIRMHDPVGDDKTGNGNGDVSLVVLHYNAHRLNVTVKWPRSGDPEHIQDLYVDTRRAERTPDLVISTNGDGEGWDVGFVKGWNLKHYQARCTGGNGSTDYDYAHHQLHFSVPRTCLMHRGAVQPQRLRVSLATRTEWEAAYDWAPGKRTFGRWVHWK